MHRVTLFFFTKDDLNTDQIVVRPRPATLGAIQRVNGEPLIETAHAVDSTEVDGNGFRRRRD